MLPGFFTAEGADRYCQRFPELLDAGHFRPLQHVPGAEGLRMSSLGLGTYLGDTTETGDGDYIRSLTAALRSGINVLDTAINYRHQRSERNIGEVLAQLVESSEIRRDEVLVCTKAGYLSFDGSVPPDAREYFTREYVDPGILDRRELVGMHCMSPRYLTDQMERSRRNLRLQTIDVFYLHNPETQLAAGVDRDLFRQRLLDAFATLEEAVGQGRIRFYGLATWNALRRGNAEQDYISLFDTLEMAREVGGEEHHFRFVQLPFNLQMTEAYAFPNQVYGRQKVSVLEFARRAGLVVVGSATLMQAQLTAAVPGELQERLGAGTSTAAAIQFARSAPGLTTSLIGMSSAEHVPENMELALRPPIPAEAWKELFKPV